MLEGNYSCARIYSREQIENINGFFVDKPGSINHEVFKDLTCYEITSSYRTCFSFSFESIRCPGYFTAARLFFGIERVRPWQYHHTLRNPEDKNPLDDSPLCDLSGQRNQRYDRL